MDGFDDLLKSSGNGFEEDPFSNPFAQTHRSASPDPWANPYAQQEQDTLTTAFSDTNLAEPSEPVDEVTATEPVDSAGPLDLSALEEEEPAPSTSGFREFRVPPAQPSAEAVAVSDELKAHASDAIPETIVDASGEPSATHPRSSTPPIIPAPTPTQASTSDTEPTAVPLDAPSSEPSADIPVINEPTSITQDTTSWNTPHETFTTPLDRPAPPFSSTFLNSDVQGDENGWGDTLDAGTATIREPSISSTAGWHSKQPTDEEDDDDKPLQAIVDRSRADAEAKHGNVSLHHQDMW
jgi:sorting nexin-1/2